MNVQIPETPNTQNEPLWTVKQALEWLPTWETIPRATLADLGRDCSRVARIWKRPTGVVPVIGQPWPSEKSYTSDVLREVFSRHPATRDAYKETQR